jgi:hypothetical protein
MQKCGHTDDVLSFRSEAEGSASGRLTVGIAVPFQGWPRADTPERVTMAERRGMEG